MNAFFGVVKGQRMAINLLELQKLVIQYGAVVRIVITDIKGSTPRGIGTSMLVWATEVSGTIGGGALEYKAIKTARDALKSKTGWTASHSLGPDLGQCCGGFVKLSGEYFDAENLPSAKDGYYLRAMPLKGLQTGEDEIPLSLNRRLSALRRKGTVSEPILVENWFLEPLASVKKDLWIWGAGHVGRALVDVVSKLPDINVTWVDTAADRFPKDPNETVQILYSDQPHKFVKHAPQDAHHLVLTYSHALDLDLCNALLSHRFSSVGLIGSQTKWARFRKRLKSLGHHESLINLITCPIGRPEFGKHPHQIAIGVASELLMSDVAFKKETNSFLNISGSR